MLELNDCSNMFGIFMTLTYDLSDIIFHFDHYLYHITNTCGIWTYAILFLIIFCETGVILTPLLPGDALLITVGTLTANNHSKIDVNVLCVLLITAAMFGNCLNYYLGKTFGQLIYAKCKLKPKYIDQTHEFYQQYGNKTIFFARFVPIVRTFAPFLAGTAAMNQKKFLNYSLSSSIVWIAGLLYFSHYLGNNLWLQNNLNIVIVLVMLCSLLPNISAYWRKKKNTCDKTRQD